MTTHEVARWFDGLRNWLGDALNKNAVNSLREVSDAFRELPEKPFKDFVKEVKSCQGGVSPLVDEINAYRSGHGGSSDKILTRINKLRSPELKEIAKAFALPVKRTVAENRGVLRAFVEGSNGASPSTNGSANGQSGDIEEGIQDYYQLKNSLGAYTIEGLRSRFESFRRFPISVLQQIAQRLGYHFSGNKEEVYTRLLQTLEGLKMSQVHGETIGRI